MSYGYGTEIGDEDLEDALAGLEHLVGDDYDDISGDDDDDALAGLELVGDDDLAQLMMAAAGARRRKKKARRAAAMARRRGGPGAAAALRQRMMAAKLAQQSVVVRDRPPMKAREYPLPITSPAAVPPGLGATITINPQVPFRVERLTFSSDIAGSFTLDNFQVGKNPQFAAAGSLPCRVLQENAVGVRFRGDTAVPGITVTLQVTNISGGAAFLRGMIVGTAIE